MATTPDRSIGPTIEEDETLYADRGASPSVVGAVARNGDSLFGRDGLGVFNLRGELAALSQSTASVLSTNLTTPQAAFTAPLTTTVAGSYLVIFEGILSFSNSTGVGEIGIGVNGLASFAGSTRSVGGVAAGARTAVSVALVTLAIGETVTGTYRFVSGAGTVSIASRSISAVRVG